MSSHDSYPTVAALYRAIVPACRTKKRLARPFRCSSIAAFVLVFAACTQGLANQTVASTVDSDVSRTHEYFEFDIDMQPIHQALVAFAEQSSLQIVWAPGQVSDKLIGPIRGRMTPDAALAALLSPIGATYEFSSENVVSIRAHLRAAPHSSLKRPGETIQETAPLYEPYRLPENDEILVTGTRLRARDDDARFTPRPTLNENDLRRSGYNDFLDAAVDAPSINAPVTPVNSQLNVSSSGQSFIELRNLGQSRTLVLFDGRRSVTNSFTSNRIDLNTIPLDLVERVEIVKGGVSAIYGADAIAGAINIKFIDNIDGLRLRARAGGAGQGGGEEFGLSLLYGAPFANGRGRFSFYLGAEHEGFIEGTDRDFALVSAEFNVDGNFLDTPDFSSTIPGGRFPRPGPDFFFDEAGLQDDFSRDENGFAFRPFNTLKLRQNRYYGSQSFNYQLSPAITVFSTTHVSLLNSMSRRAPELIRDSDTNLEIPIDNPFIPDAIRNDALARGETGIRFSRRLTELGQRKRRAERLTVRHWTGIKGREEDRYRWELTAGYGRYEQRQTRSGLVLIPNFINALNVEPDPAGGAMVRCINAEARAAGCVPINIFGVNAVSSEAADYVGFEDRLKARLSQLTIAGAADGPIFQLPAGPIDAAAGFEWRRDRLDIETDPATQAGLTTAASIANFNASQSVFDVFTELRVPLFSEDHVLKKLTVQGAARLTRYSVGADRFGVSYSAGATWVPLPVVQIDGKYAKSIREPNLSERFSPPRGDIDRVRDPCSGIDAAQNDTLALNCRENFGVNQQILTNGVFLQNSSSVSGPNAGNRDLSFEVGRSFSLRAALAPDVRFKPKLSIEYFNTTVDGAIAALSSLQITRQCYLRIDAGRQRFCDLITRDGDGQLSEILNQEQNLITIRSEGIESDLTISTPLNLLGHEVDVRFSLRHLRLLTLDNAFPSPLQGDAVDVDLGEPGSAKDTAQFIASLDTNAASIRWRTQYASPTVDSDARGRLFDELGVSNPLFFNIPANWRHDIYIERRFTARGDTKIYAGINNLLNQTGPFFPQGTVQGGTDNHISEFDVVGRFFFAGIEANF